MQKKTNTYTVFFAPSELELLITRENRFANLELRNKVIISLLIYQGLVCSELCRQELNDIDLDDGTICVNSSKNSSLRTLNLKQNQIKLLMD